MNPMFKQYRQKKKRAVNPDAPPRPTLLGHEKQMKEFGSTLQAHDSAAASTQNEVTVLKRRVARLEATVNQLITALRK